MKRRKSKFAVAENEKYGRWTVLNEFKDKISKKGFITRTVSCKCDCGVVENVNISTLVKGLTKSCGCYSAELASVRNKELNTTHNQTVHPLNSLWRGMIARCENSEDLKYGGKGVTVCERWKNDHDGFINFIEDIGERPSEKYSIDRIDSKGNYEPSNCRWATNNIQGFNQQLRSTNTSGRTGVRLTKWETWNSSITFEGKRINLGTFENYKDAVKARELGELKYYGWIKNE